MSDPIIAHHGLSVQQQGKLFAMAAVLARHSLIATLFVVVTVLYAVVVPPFEVRDELAHFARAYQAAYWIYPSVRVGDQPGAMMAGPLARIIHDWQPDAVSGIATKRPVSRIWHDVATPDDSVSGPAFATFANVGSYPPIFYVAQSVGLRLGHVVGLPPLGQFYAGRLAGAALAIALVLTGVALLPYGGRAMLVIATLPGVSSQLASYSADSLIFGIAFLGTAIVLREPEKPPAWARSALPVLLVLLTLAKGVYLPIAAAGLGERAAWQPRRLAWALVWMAAGLIVFAVWFGVFAAGDINVQHYMSRRTLQHMTAATPHEQLAFMSSHPGAAAWAIVSTSIERLPVYALDCIGRLGWPAMLLPLPLYALGTVVAIGGAVATGADGPPPTPRQRALWLAIVAGVFALVHVALYMVSTAVGADYVEGVQGRYLIPVLPLLMLALRLRPSATTGRIVDATLPWGAALLMVGGLLAAADAFWQW